MESKLDKLLEVLKDMTDEEIVEATKYVNYQSVDTIDLSDFEIAPFEVKVKKKMICISMERYEELLETEKMYKKWKYKNNL